MIRTVIKRKGRHTPDGKEIISEETKIVYFLFIPIYWATKKLERKY